jgi:hypothetical protein
VIGDHGALSQLEVERHADQLGRHVQEALGERDQLALR